MKLTFKALITLLMITTPLFAGAQEAFLGTWTGRLEVSKAKITLVLNINAGDNGTLICTLDSPDQGAKGIPAQAQIDGGVALKVNVPSLGASYSGVIFRNSLVGTFTQLGKEFPLTFTRGEEKLNRPQTPSAPFPYKAEDVTFINEKAGATLVGTLFVPEGATAATPVVIMVTGSGMQNRDEELFEHKPFLVIADYLARHGIATLRYDDRGYGQSKGGEVKNATTPDFRDDAKAGIEYLRAGKRFGKVGVLGHSEGASIAFMLGTSKDADFVISLAGIGVRGDEALCAQANRLMELYGSPERISVDQYRKNALSQRNAWISWFINYDPVPDVMACKCPVFAAGGEKDIQVISSLNLESIRHNLPEGDVNFIKEYPALNHLFQHCTTGDVNEYRSIEETFSEEVLADLAAWIGKVDR